MRSAAVCGQKVIVGIEGNYVKSRSWDREGNYVKSRSWDREGNYVKSRSWDREGNYVKVIVGIERVTM